MEFRTPKVGVVPIIRNVGFRGRRRRARGLNVVTLSGRRMGQVGCAWVNGYLTGIAWRAVQYHRPASALVCVVELFLCIAARVSGGLDLLPSALVDGGALNI